MILNSIIVKIYILSFVLYELTPGISGTVVFMGRTTACDTCDGIQTFSMRNIICCSKFSKCCIPDTIDGFNREVERQKYNKQNLRTSLSTTVTTNSKPSKTRKKKRKINNKLKNISTK